MSSSQMPEIRSKAKLFQPILVGNLELSHRIVHAPLTRFRADEAHVPSDLTVEYYAQRSSIPGTLLITEATIIAPKAGGYNNLPGIWSDEQVAAWKKVVDVVHAQDSFIFLQLWATGRAGYAEFFSQPDCPANPGGPHPYVSASDLPLSDRKNSANPRPLSHDEILEYIELFGQAARNAVHRAGFDGVEIHGANGYLIDQFTQGVSNKRIDQWGGSIDNRIRFALEVVKKVSSVVGEERTGLRISPFSTFQDMRMEHPQPTFTALVARIREAHPHLAFLHVIEPRMAGIEDRTILQGESNDFLRAIWNGPGSMKNRSVFISAGGYTPDTAINHAEGSDELVAFGRYYISNPDLPARIKNNIPITPYDRDYFYTPGLPKGYIDYPFADSVAELRFKEKWAERRGPNV